MIKTSQTWNIGDPITAERLNEVNNDLDSLFESLAWNDLDFTYNINNQLEQVVDNENSITINIDWTDWESDPAVLYIHEAWKLKKFKILYDNNGYFDTITKVTA